MSSKAASADLLTRLDHALTRRPQVILPCNSDRVLGRSLEGAPKGGIRYPTPSFLRYRPIFPDHYYRLFDDWEKMEK